jgi:predicted nucleic acid-binding Zn ribbon protein
MYDFRCVETGEIDSVFLSIEELEEYGQGFEENMLGKPPRHWKRVYTPPAIHFHGSGFYSNGG